MCYTQTPANQHCRDHRAGQDALMKINVQVSDKALFVPPGTPSEADRSVLLFVGFSKKPINILYLKAVSTS